jgi:hypothetical protein
MMEKEPNAFYDDGLFPKPGETEEQFEKRMKALRIKREARMTEEDKHVACILAKGKISEADRKALIID